MNKVLGILGTVGKVMTFVTSTIVAIVSLLTAYILFAPDQLPKPFHLVYDYGNGTTSLSSGAGAAPAASAATPTPEPHKFKPGEGIMANMATKIINLADPAGRKYIRLTMVVEFEPDNPDYLTMAAEEKATYTTEFTAKITALMPVMDDTVITLLSTKTFEDLYTADGKEKLRGEILKALSDKLPDLKILSVYFTEFVVQ
jgi:flagellar protein FliL